jgi:HEAT repeat protein
MPKPRGVDSKLDRLRALRRESAADGHVAELRQALEGAWNLVAEAAASIAGERGLSDLAADLVAAFDRFMIDPIETDPRCRAKIAIVEALNKIDDQHEGVFLRGLRHFQEAGRPNEDDPAAPLRGHSALGLARIRYPGVVLLLVDLFFDSAVAARVAAAQALGDLGSPAAIPLLRFKALHGDKSSDVTGACLSALMSADPEESLSFVAQFLSGRGDAIQADAALALGESRRPDALDILIGHWPNAHASFAEVLLLAIAMTRLPAALDFLLGILTKGKRSAALATLSALTIHRHNDAIKERIAAALAEKGDAALFEKFKKKFGE